MSLRMIARLGNPVLLRPADPIDPDLVGAKDFQRLVDDMIETMMEAPGVGLAAPQVHESIRLFVMDPGDRDDSDVGLEILVNPRLSVPEDGDYLSLWEGCLSIPGLRGETLRHAAVDVEYLDRNGEPRRRRFEGFAAAVVQHEYDHLDGVLFLKRMPDLSLLAFDDQYARWFQDCGS